MLRTKPRRAAVSLVALLPVAALAFSAGTAQAITGGPSAPQTLPASSSAMWQTNDSVWALAYSNNILYAAGNFTAISSPDGATSITMTRIAAFHANEADSSLDGTPCTVASPCQGIGAWKDKNVGGKVWALNVTPDGSKLYIGGDFTKVTGLTRTKLAGFDLTKPGQPVLATPAFAGQVRAIATTNDTAFVGGVFTTTTSPGTGQTAFAQPRLASFNIADGTVRTDFTPVVGSAVYALLMGPGADSANLVLGGDFRTVNGEAHSGVAQVDAATGKVNGPMSNTIIPGVTQGSTGPNFSDVKALTTDGTNIFLGAEGTGYGVFDGTAAVNPSTGQPVWRDNCLGATQGIAVLGGVLYVGSHSHNCSFLPKGGFPQLPFNGDDRSWHHLIAEQAEPDGTTNSGGQLLNWFPNTNAGPGVNVANELGPRAVATDGTHLYYGGEFTTVNGVAQRGLTRFTPGPDTTAPTAPLLTATSPAAGKVTIRWTGSSDLDDATLTYTITRDGGAPTGVVTPSIATPVSSPFWQSPIYTYRDASVPAGTHTYTVRVTDADNLTSSASIGVTVATAATGGYSAKVLADGPSFYWRLNETSGTVAKDSSPNLANGTLRGSPTLGRPGAIGTDKAIRMNNTTTNGVSSNLAAALAPANYSLEAWFRVDPTNRGGGRLIGFSNAATGVSTTPNRTIYLMNSGQLIYSIFTSDGSTCHYGTTYGLGGTCYVWGKQAYNDGTWHHVVATQSATTGMALYVDGARVASESSAPALIPKVTNGVWRVGADKLSTFPQPPSNAAKPLLGDVDEVAVYPYVLTPAQVFTHWQSAE